MTVISLAVPGWSNVWKRSSPTLPPKFCVPIKLKSWSPLRVVFASMPERSILSCPDVIEDIALFVDARITHPEKGERHWTESAQAVLQALILMVVSDARFSDRRHLLTVRRLLTPTDPAIEKMQEADAEMQEEHAKARARAKRQDNNDGGSSDGDDEPVERQLAALNAACQLSGFFTQPGPGTDINREAILHQLTLRFDRPVFFTAFFFAPSVTSHPK